MTPEEAEAFRAALESLLRTHRVYLVTPSRETISVFTLPPNYDRVDVQGYWKTNGYAEIRTDAVAVKAPTPKPSQEPGTISPDTPW